jgi:hypothetical protein
MGSNPIRSNRNYLEYSQMVRHAFLIRLFIGSNPIIPKKISYNGEMEDTLGLGSNSIL